MSLHQQDLPFLPAPRFTKGFLGLDASLNTTGATLVEPGVVRSRRLEPDCMGVARLVWLRLELSSMIAQHRPVLVAVEGYAMSRGNRAHQIGEWGGVLRMVLVDMDVPMLVVPPSKVKQFAAGKGTADKSQVALGLFKKWQLEFPTEDETDAAALAMIALHIAHKDLPRTTYQEKALAGITVEQRGVRVRHR